MHAVSLQPDPVKAICEPLRRWPFGLTGRTLAMLAAGFLLLIPGFWYGRLSYAMLVWDGLVMLAAWLDGRRLPSATELSVERRWAKAAALDENTELEIVLHNRGRILLDCRVEDDLPPALSAEGQTLRIAVFPGEPASIRYEIEPQERGDWKTGSLYLRYRSPLGLVEKWAKARLIQSVRVYPGLRASEEQAMFLSRSRQIDLQLRQVRQRGMGRDFESLREYREGDDLRDICWTATARRGMPITRQYQTERSQPVWIVLDCGRLMQARGTAGGGAKTERVHTKLDFACSAAVALAQLALYSGDRVGLLAYGRDIQQRLLPGRGSAHLRQMIELLAQVRTEPGEADHLHATTVLSRMQPRRALILWITDFAETAMRPEVIDGASQLLTRHLVLFVAMAQPEVERIASTRPGTVEEMFRAAAAQEMVERRELLLARLRDQGALTLDLNPQKLTSAVLNQYLMVKERAMV